MAAYNLDYSEDTLASMAASTTDMDTKEFLSCSICWEVYDDNTKQPKLLACHHTFCKECLKRISRGRKIIQCSACRKDTEIIGSVNSLQTNFYVMYMKQKVAEQEKKSISHCNKHSLQPLSFFCKTCMQMVCRDCIVLAHSRSEGHELQELSQVKAELVNTVEQYQSKIDDGIHRREKHLLCLRAELESMDIVSEIANKEIDETFNQLTEVINARRQQVKDTLREAHEMRQRILNEQLVEVDNQMTRLIELSDKLEDATIKGYMKDLVEVATDRQLNDQLSVFENLTLNLGKNYLHFQSVDAESLLQNFISNIGEIREKSMLPSQISLNYEKATACLETKITVAVKTHSSEPLPGYPIKLEILDPAGDEVTNVVKDNDDGTYTVIFRPQISGGHLCTVKFLGRKMPSSCMSLAVQSNDPVKVIGSMGKDEGKLMYPCSLKIDSHDNLYIVDEGNQRIQKFCSAGQKIVLSVAGPSKDARTFDCAIDDRNDELICSKVLVEQRKAWADTIQIHSLNGTLKRQFTNTSMKKALYVAVNSMKQIIVTDYYLNTLYIYNHQGELLREVGTTGKGPGEFKEPAFVCIGKDDDIIVSDCRNSRVQVLSKDGEFKYQIGTKGNGKGQLQSPSGVTTDRFGHILVTDRLNNRILVFTYEGQFVSCIESSGNKLNDPRGLAVSSDGFVFVADQKNHCIKKYKYM